MAFLAGKLMSNEFVYGSFIHLDAALFKIRNAMKNIANFLLGFLFLFSILKSFFSKDAFELKKTLPRFLIAGVLIQMSRFIMGAFVDLANIATAAVGSFPSQFLESSTDNLDKNKFMQLAVTVPTRIDVSFKENEELFTTYTGTQTIENMFGKFNDMSGPLMFLGASIFRFQDYAILNQEITSRKNFSIALFLKIFLLLVFTVPLFVLIVVNLIRIFRLRIRISFSPLAAIARSFDDKETPGVIKQTGEKLGFGKLSDVLALIFQPVAMIGALSLVLILSTGIYYVLGGDPGDLNASGSYEKTLGNIELSSKDNSSTLKDTISGTEFTVDGNLVKNIGGFVGGMIGYLIVTGFCGVLIWSLIKIGSSFSKFTKSSADAIFSFAENAVKTAKIIPLGGTMLSLGGLQQAGKDVTQGASTYFDKKLGTQKDNLVSSFYKTDFGKGYEKFTGDSYAEKQVRDIGSGEAAKLSGSLAQSSGNIKSIGDKLKAFGDQRKQSGGNISLQSKNFMNEANKLLANDIKFRNDLAKYVGANLGTDEKPEFNTTPGNNMKLLQGLIFLINNGYDGSITSPITLQDKVEQLTESQKIDNKTLFIKPTAPAA